MYLDVFAELASATTVVGAVGTNNIGSTIDLETSTDNTLFTPTSCPIYMVLAITTTIDVGTAGTVVFQIVSDATDPPATDGTQTIHWQTPAFATNPTPPAALTAPATLFAGALPLWPGWVNTDPPTLTLGWERFVGLQCVVGAFATTAGAVDCFLTLDPSRWLAHATRITDPNPA